MKKIIVCPFCRTKNVVGHMDWTAIKCIKSKCNRTIHQDIEIMMDEVFSTVHRNLNKLESELIDKCVNMKNEIDSLMKELE